MAHQVIAYGFVVVHVYCGRGGGGGPFGQDWHWIYGHARRALPCDRNHARVPGFVTILAVAKMLLGFTY